MVLSVFKGSQPESRILEDAAIAAVKFVDEFLNGKILITNKPLELIKKCKMETDDLIKEVS